MAYLTGGLVRPARRLDVASPRIGGGGAVRAGLGRGALMLVPGPSAAPGLEPVRLVYRAEGDEVDVPAGSYRLRNYAVVRAREGVDWTLSGSGPGEVAVEVRPGETTRLVVDAELHVELKAARHGAEVRANLPIVGHRGMGVSLYRGDRRVEARLEVRGGDGARLAGAPLQYG